MKHYDLIICGGGLAGLTMALQIKERLSSLSILVVDQEQSPVQEAQHKVGESTVHPGGMYLCKIIGLHDYLIQHHVEKYGLRYFFHNNEEFNNRPELGRSVYDNDIFEYQLDRGVLENYLREKVTDVGIDFIDGETVSDVELSENASNHIISISSENNLKKFSSKWLIDASGRRRIIQRKLSLKAEKNDSISSAWFRIKGKLKVDDFVSSTKTEWHSRVSKEHPIHSEFGRYNSTNHLMGDGRWVWLIPLGSGHTSVGIVADENIIPFANYNSKGKAMKWLELNEPDLANKLPLVEEWVDFKMMRNYSYTCENVYSPNRWYCTGEAGVFVDPWQSPGTDSIAISNSLITEIIARDYLGHECNPELIKELNDYFINYTRTATFIIQKGYPYFGDEVITTLIVILYLTWSMSTTVPILKSKVFKANEIANNGWYNQNDIEQIQRINDIARECMLAIIALGDKRKINHRKLNFSWLDWWGLPFFKNTRDIMLNNQKLDWDLNESQVANLFEALKWISSYDQNEELPNIKSKALQIALDLKNQMQQEMTVSNENKRSDKEVIDML